MRSCGTSLKHVVVREASWIGETKLMMVLIRVEAAVHTGRTHRLRRDQDRPVTIHTLPTVVHIGGGAEEAAIGAMP